MAFILKEADELVDYKSKQEIYMQANQFCRSKLQVEAKMKWTFMFFDSDKDHKLITSFSNVKKGYEKHGFFCNEKKKVKNSLRKIEDFARFSASNAF